MVIACRDEAPDRRGGRAVDQVVMPVVAGRGDGLDGRVPDLGGLPARRRRTDCVARSRDTPTNERGGTGSATVHDHLETLEHAVEPSLDISPYSSVDSRLITGTLCLISQHVIYHGRWLAISPGESAGSQQ